MFSRFFSNIHFRRVLCCLLALLTFGCCLSPALVQPAEAVAVADDILIASLALLATSWAGVTFATNGGANTAISNLLQSKPAVKLSLAGLLTKNLVVEGTKLLLTRDVRDVFETVLPEIKGFFQTESDNVVSSGGGSLVDSVVVGSSFPVTSFSSWSDDRVPYSFNLESFIGCIFMATDPSFGTQYLRVDSDAVRSIRLSNGEWVDGGVFFSLRDGGALFKFEFFRPKAQFLFSVHFNHYNNVSYELLQGFKCTSPQISLVSATASTPYYTSKEVDGTSALEILQPAPLYVVDPSGGDDKDPTEGTKPEINFKYAMIALEGLIGALTLSGSDAQKDPGIKPDEMIEQLKKAMESYNTDPDPNPDPDPDPDPTDPYTPSTGSPSFDSMKVPTLKDFFPFCIPFDLYAMMQALCADPVAPSFTFATSFLGHVYTVDIDLSAWNDVATVVRYMVVAIYIVALAVATRKFIKW